MPRFFGDVRRENFGLRVFLIFSGGSNLMEVLREIGDDPGAFLAGISGNECNANFFCSGVKTEPGRANEGIAFNEIIAGGM